MQDIIQNNNKQINNLNVDQFNSSDLQGEDLFNQIQLNECVINIGDQQMQQQAYKNGEEPMSEKKEMRIKKNNLQLDSDQQDNIKPNKQQSEEKLKMQSARKNKKRIKQQKKLKKKLKKKVKKQKKLKKLKQEGQKSQPKQNSQDWSAQFSESSEEDSQASSDSLLQRLNPKKKKIKSTQKKQGFSLKQLGNNPQVQLQNKQDQSDSSYSNKDKKRNKKNKLQKKQVVKNQQILQLLRQKGICDEEQNQQQKRQDYQYDNGLEQVLNMKNSKKKGPKIANRLFQDMEIDDKQQKNQPSLQQIQLQIKPKVISTPSLISQSFLNKAEKIKRARGMNSEIQGQHIELQKLASFKARQSMVQLVNRKQLGQIDQIQLDVKVPEIVKGSGELNNSIFLKKISSNVSKKEEPIIETKKQTNKPLQKLQPKSKLSRFDFFKSINQQLKQRKSRQVTNQLIANSFKITNLQQIEDMRKKNQQKRRRQALHGSDDQQQQYLSANQMQNEKQQHEIKQNKLGFMHSKIQKENPQIELNLQKQIKNSDKVEHKQKIEDQYKQNKVQKKLAIQIKNSLPNQQLKKLLRIQQGQENFQHQQQFQRNQQQIEEQKNQIINDAIEQDDIENKMQSQQQNNDLNSYNNQQNQEQQQYLNAEQIQSAARVQLQVDLQISEQSQNQLQSQNNQQLQNKQQINQQYQQYLNQLEAQGIKLKKNHKRQHNSQINRYDQRSYEKQNNQLMQNNEKAGYLSEESEARKQFRKLRKLATIIKNKKKAYMKIQRAVQFYDQEAQEGSDNEQHDGEVKKINDDDQAKMYEGLDLDLDLQQLIDNAVDIDEQNQELAFRKFQQDVKLQDRQELKRIMKGDFKRKRQHQPLMDQIQEDEKKRIQRMEQIQQYIRKKQIEEGKQLYLQNQQQKQKDQDGDSEDNQSENIEQNKNQKVVMVQEEVDEMNEENLKRYLDQGIVDSYRTTVTIKKPIIELPQSIQRTKKTQTRNNIKPKQNIHQLNMKLKRNPSSRLNQMIMKNKQTIKPIIFMKNFSTISIRK